MIIWFGILKPAWQVAGRSRWPIEELVEVNQGG
jgi:hypothetical protein